MDAYILASKELDAASECLAYELNVCEEDATSWLLRIEWSSTEEHLEGFRKRAAVSAVSCGDSGDSSRRLLKCVTTG